MLSCFSSQVWCAVGLPAGRDRLSGAAAEGVRVEDGAHCYRLVQSDPCSSFVCFQHLARSRHHQSSLFQSGVHFQCFRSLFQSGSRSLLLHSSLFQSGMRFQRLGSSLVLSATCFQHGLGHPALHRGVLVAPPRDYPSLHLPNEVVLRRDGRRFDPTAPNSAATEPRFRELYKELVETNTTLSAGSCTLAAERMAARLRRYRGIGLP